MMAMNGERDGGPTRVPVSPIDQVTGLYAALGIQAALLERSESGRGAYLEVSLFETATALLGFTLPGFLGRGHRAGAHRPPPTSRSVPTKSSTRRTIRS